MGSLLRRVCQVASAAISAWLRIFPVYIFSYGDLNENYYSLILVNVVPMRSLNVSKVCKFKLYTFFKLSQLFKNCVTNFFLCKHIKKDVILLSRIMEIFSLKANLRGCNFPLFTRSQLFVFCVDFVQKTLTLSQKFTRLRTQQGKGISWIDRSENKVQTNKFRDGMSHSRTIHPHKAVQTFSTPLSFFNSSPR